ncbi:NADH-quinone oxidoreductase subunit B family protein [Acetomicrobium sp. S15 = DSM 107314]|jgi:membrane-bound hydrogenase subunit mbhJ|uniref:NADH-quinone oxidoreductase subunit B family protein n=1 Tax=Acetomicrobium sp. S15 = DSM 107314 TaxID=2529858 RepID=UPI00406CF650
MLKMDLAKTLEILPRSIWVFLCNSGSCNGCDIEVVATLTPRYDIERFGMKLVGSPRHADALLVTGPVTKYMTERLKHIYDQMPDPKVVIVVGNCGCSGDVFYKSYSLDGPVDQVLPVDVYVHGCPPRPEAIIEGVAKAVLKLEALRESLDSKEADVADVAQS